MKRLLCILLVLVMVLSMAGCAEEDSPRRKRKEKETETATETATEPVTEVTAPIQPLEVLVGGQYINRWTENYVQLAYVSWQDVILSDSCAEEYPKLASALNQRNRDLHALGDETLEMLCENAEADIVSWGDNFPGYMDDTRAYVQRADSRIFSLCYQYETFNGGMRPYSGTTCMNLDPATGEPVTIDQIITDMDALPQLLTDALREKCADLPEDTFHNTAEQLESYGPDAYTWTIGYQGVTFYFGSYELTDGSAGALTVTLWFADNPKLFAESYTRSPENGYVLTLPQSGYTDVDLKPSEKGSDQLAVGLNEEGRLWIELNDSRIYNEEFYAYYLDAYLVTPDNENFYLYIDSSSDNDYRAIHVYELKAGQPILRTVLWGHGMDGQWIEKYEFGETYFVRHFNDPSSYTLFTRADMLSTISGTRSYHTDPKTGLPQTDAEYYTLSSGMPPLVSLIPLKVKMLPDEAAETLPAGTKFYFLRTDNETYVDMALEDGRECRIYVVRRDWEWIVDGHSEYDCFENLMYAG